ncbi:hypothetical protein DOTSEDRAFT_74972 [Dothistroma septosporum NZE10]|uniref:Uncharacterized protein n=1 Tax=Dothistroma septosporum (strain NZE10 / CBS 128990) TaxID=675120 RepID=N1PDB4_DOTSN|nr:hypothetical protein DOTSEDRAFT_74972 [Dothistroma septosporum NZE10]
MWREHVMQNCCYFDDRLHDSTTPNGILWLISINSHCIAQRRPAELGSQLQSGASQAHFTSSAEVRQTRARSWLNHDLLHITEIPGAHLSVSGVTLTTL